jgi:hypothetical protein
MNLQRAGHDMNKITFVAVTVGWSAFVHGISYGAPSDTTAGQPPLAHYLSPAEVSKLKGIKTPGGANVRALTHLVPNGTSSRVRSNKSDPVFVGGPANPKKNAAISGKWKSAKNAAAINGNDATGRQ